MPFFTPGTVAPWWLPAPGEGWPAVPPPLPSGSWASGTHIAMPPGGRLGAGSPQVLRKDQPGWRAAVRGAPPQGQLPVTLPSASTALMGSPFPKNSLSALGVGGSEGQEETGVLNWEATLWLLTCWMMVDICVCKGIIATGKVQLQVGRAEDDGSAHRMHSLEHLQSVPGSLDATGRCLGRGLGLGLGLRGGTGTLVPAA